MLRGLILPLLLISNDQQKRKSKAKVNLVHLSMPEPANSHV